MLSPITPHIANELWVAFGHTDSVLDAQWPVVDEAALVKDSIEMVVQVNGKVRAKLELPANISKEEAEAIARADENVIKFVGESTIRKVIVIPGKLVNIVAN
jgi:leucyl-tRNA synthetase